MHFCPSLVKSLQVQCTIVVCKTFPSASHPISPPSSFLLPPLPPPRYFPPPLPPSPPRFFPPLPSPPVGPRRPKSGFQKKNVDIHFFRRRPSGGANLTKNGPKTKNVDIHFFRRRPSGGANLTQNGPPQRSISFRGGLKTGCFLKQNVPKIEN